MDVPFAALAWISVGRYRARPMPLPRQSGFDDRQRGRIPAGGQYGRLPEEAGYGKLALMA